MAETRNNSLSPVLRVLGMTVQLSWGVLQTFLGFLIFLAHVARPHRLFRACVLTEWRLEAGLSLGLFVFVPEGANEALIAHEYGHCLQSLLLGPLYLPLAALPSFVWAGLPALGKHRVRKGISYYALFTERNANFLAAYLCQLDPVGIKDLKSKRVKDMLGFRRRRQAVKHIPGEGGNNV